VAIYIKKNHIISNILLKFRLNPIDSVPTAWDFLFSQDKRRWVEVTLISGKKIRSLFQNYSCASSDIKYRDLYLEKLYYQDSKDYENQEARWQIVEDSEGVWINPDEIRYMKFFKLEE